MTTPHSSKGPVIYGAQGGKIVWPTRTRPYADTMPGPTQLPPPNNTGLLFDADFPRHGMARYQLNNIANNAAVPDLDYGVCADPTGTGQIVGWCDNLGGKTNTNEFGRSQMLTRRIIYPARRTDGWGNYAHYARYYIHPVTTFTTSSDWFTIQGFHGPPFIGPSSTGLMVTYNPTTGKHYFRVGNVEGRAPQEQVTVPIGRWFQVLCLFRYSAASEGGWFDLFLNDTTNTETGWRRVPIEGGYRKPFDMISDEEGNAWLTDPTRGPTYAGWGVYGNHRAFVYCAEQRLGTTTASVMPPGWSGTITGIRPDTMWEPAPPPTPPYTGNPTGGTGGALADTNATSFTSGSLTSVYHTRAAHLTGPGPHPLVIHLHGDGYEEYTSMANNTVDTVANHYAQVAQQAGALFILPRTPDTTNETWWSKTSSNTWLMGLYDHLCAGYNIDRDRIYWSGYSGGAENITYNITADHHTKFTGGAAMILGGGGAEGLSLTGTPTPTLKSNYPMHWHVGALDSDDGTGWSALDASAGGESFYRAQGFTTSRTLIPAAGHVASEVYGPHALATVVHAATTARGLPAPPNPDLVRAGPTSSTQIPAATTAKTINTPTGTPAAAMMVMALTVYGTTPAGTTVPPGWTVLAEGNRGTNHRLILAWRTATTNEPATHTLTIPTGLTARADIYTFTGVATTGPTSATINSTPTGTVHYAPAVAPTTDSGAILCAVTGAGGNTWTPHPWLIELTDQPITTSPYLTLAAAYHPTKTLGRTNTRSFTASAGSYTHLTASLYLPAHGSK